MNTLDLKQIGVQELTKDTAQKVDGGNPFLFVVVVVGIAAVVYAVVDNIIAD